MEKAKGEGKPLDYVVNTEAILEYLEDFGMNNGDMAMNMYVVATQYGGQPRQMSDRVEADYSCSDVLSDILGRRINPHLF